MTTGVCGVSAPIVVGTDGSAAAAKAITVAIDLARRFDQPLHVVVAYRSREVGVGPLPPALGPIGPSASYAWASAISDHGVRRARSASVAAEAHVLMGGAAEALLAVSDQVDAGLIVVGCRGLGARTPFSTGTVPDKLVRRGTRSVHVVA